MFPCIRSCKEYPMLRALLAALMIAATLSGCATMSRTPYTAADDSAAVVEGIPNARVWADDSKALLTGLRDQPGALMTSKSPSLLALSGGGSEGAYGAGFLTCWTKTNTRPEFSVVTGASVGALIAPFAFLGSDYDPIVASMFTSGETSGLLKPAGLAGLFGSGLFKGEPLQRLVDHYVTRDLLDRIAAQYKRGRRLLVVTTDLDNQRTALWDMGVIASSDSPNALQLFKTVLLASASIPGIFPPQLIPVQGKNGSFEEMHVDAGVTANVLAIPDAMLTSSFSFAPGVHPNIFIIINGKGGPDFSLVDNGLLPIFERSFETSIKANTRNSLIATSEYAKRHGWSFYATAIKESVPTTSPTDFNINQMRTLFANGCAQASSKDRWPGVR
jgi:hypothetical protein